MRRFKITVSPKNKSAGIFSSLPVLWDVVDTTNHRAVLQSVSKDVALTHARKLELQTA